MNKNYELFAIVAFDEHNETDVVPSLWLVDQGRFCWWPNYRSPAKVVSSVKQMEVPTKENFTLYRSRVLKTYSSYDMAQLHIKKAENESELSSEASTPPNSRRSKFTSRRRVKPDIESSSENDSDIFPDPPKFPRLEAVKHNSGPSFINGDNCVNVPSRLDLATRNNAGNSSVQAAQGFMFQNYQIPVGNGGMFQHPLLPNVEASPANCQLSFTSTASERGCITTHQETPEFSECRAENVLFRQPQGLPNIPSNTYSSELLQVDNRDQHLYPNRCDYQSHPNAPSSGSTKNSPSDMRPTNEGLQDCFITGENENDNGDAPKRIRGSEFENWMIRNMTIVKAQLKQLQESVDTLLQNGDRVKLQKMHMIPDISEFAKLPIENTTQLELFFGILGDKTKRDLLVNNLSVHGGKNFSECTRRVLSALLTDEAAERISWLGSRGDKLSFSKSFLKTLVFDTVRQNGLSAAATDFQIEQVIKEWLKNAKKRLQRNSVRSSPRADDCEDAQTDD